MIEAATDLIYEHGVSGFSLRQAAREVGVDPTASYRHFRDRGEILIAVAQQGFILLADEMNSVTAKLGSRRRIEELGYRYLAFARTHPAHFRLMFGESGIPSRDPLMRAPELARSPFDHLQESLDSWARNNGHKLDINDTALLLWASVHGFARLVLDGAVPLNPKTADAAAWKLAKSALDSSVK